MSGARIGLLTYHRVVNEGSVLQAACLQRFLQARYPGAEVEVIDYRPARKEWTERLRVLSKHRPFIDRGHLPKMRQTRSFVAESLRLSCERCVTDDGDRAARFIAAMGYDVVVVGSDTVWADQAKVSKLPAPNAYFLPGPKNARHVAFAASTDQSDRSRWRDARHVARLRDLVARFDAITVRDASTEADLVDWGVPAAHIAFMPDPTLLWDPSEFVTEPPPALRALSRPLALVAVSHGHLRRSATDALRNQGYEVLNLLGPAAPGQRTLPARTQFGERLALFRLAAVVVTDRFHGSILALRLGHAVVVPVERGSAYPDRASKLRDLFARLGADDLVWRHEVGSVDPDHLRAVLTGASRFTVLREHALPALVASAEPGLARIDAVIGVPPRGRANAQGGHVAG